MCQFLHRDKYIWVSPVESDGYWHYQAVTNNETPMAGLQVTLPHTHQPNYEPPVRILISEHPL